MFQSQNVSTPRDYIPSRRTWVEPGPAQGDLGFSTNNLYANFPPMMNDGRTFWATYQPDAVANQHLLKKHNIHSNWHYRRFLSNNAKDIHESNYRNSLNDVGYYRRYADVPQPDLKDKKNQ